MVQEFTTSLLSNSSIYNQSNNDYNQSDIGQEQRLIPISEHWSQNSNKRNSGRYTQAPDEQTFTDMMSCLIKATSDINANLQLPSITPDWINNAVGLLLSTQTYGTYHNCPPVLPPNAPDTLHFIRTFLIDWFKDDNHDSQISHINFRIPANETPKNTAEQLIFMLENIFIPLLDCNIIANRVYLCKSCNVEIKMRTSLTYIPINVNKNGLCLERELINAFSPTTSDVSCSRCKKFLTRHIEVLRWPQVLIVSITDSKPTSRYRKPPGVLSMETYSDWITIGIPSSTLYDLVAFNSVLHVGNQEKIVRVSKVNQNWRTSAHKRIIGNGDRLRALYGNSRKFNRIIKYLEAT